MEFANASVRKASSVTLSATTLPETSSDWQSTSSALGSPVRSEYEVRINTGAAAPTDALSVTLTLPASLAAAISAGGSPAAFGQFFEAGGDEVLDGFEALDSVSVSGGALSVTLPPALFTNQRTTDDSFEAVVIVAVLQEGAQAALSITTRSRALATAVLPSPLGFPLGRLQVNSAFRTTVPRHGGTDYAAGDGTSVAVLAPGVVETIGFDERPLRTPDPRSGKLVKGWGRYVVIRHDRNLRTLYAHLRTDGVLVAVGDSLLQGDVVAVSGNTGGSSGPHLHVEYRLSGGRKVDPALYVGATGAAIEGSFSGSGTELVGQVAQPTTDSGTFYGVLRPDSAASGTMIAASLTIYSPKFGLRRLLKRCGPEVSPVYSDTCVTGNAILSTDRGNGSVVNGPAAGNQFGAYWWACQSLAWDSAPLANGTGLVSQGTGSFFESTNNQQRLTIAAIYGSCTARLAHGSAN